MEGVQEVGGWTQMCQKSGGAGLAKCRAHGRQICGGFVTKKESKKKKKKNVGGVTVVQSTKKCVVLLYARGTRGPGIYRGVGWK